MDSELQKLGQMGKSYLQTIQFLNTEIHNAIVACARFEVDRPFETVEGGYEAIKQIKRNLNETMRKLSERLEAYANDDIYSE